MNFLLVTVTAGILATAGMTLVLWLITRIGWTNADMVRALGGFITRSTDNAMSVGALVHFGVGIPIAMLYTIAFNIIQVNSFVSMVITGGIIGFVHGFFFSFVMLIVSEYHPVEQFQKADFQVALAHLIGHVIYGVLVGFIIGISGYQLTL